MPVQIEQRSASYLHREMCPALGLESQRRHHSPAKRLSRQRLSDCAQHLDDFAMQFTAQAISATIASSKGVSRATADAQKAIKTAKIIPIVDGRQALSTLAELNSLVVCT
jgi:hypothetical protein